MFLFLIKHFNEENEDKGNEIVTFPDLIYNISNNIFNKNNLNTLCNQC